MSASSRAAVRCPTCASTAVLPIVYGLPSGDDHERAQRGEFVLGGCLVGLHDPDPDPTHFCTACESSFDAVSGIVATP